MAKEVQDVDASDFPEHPLFPVDEGMLTPDIQWIQVTRREDGVMKWGPCFEANQLTSSDQIVERFGGGQYELIGRTTNKTFPGTPGKYTKRRLITLPGKPKALAPDNPTMSEKIASGMMPDPSIPVPPPVVQPPGLMGDSGVLIAILNMNQQAALAAAQQSEKFMMLMMQMMQDGKKEAAANSQQMMQMFTQMSTASQQSMMQLLPLLLGNKGGGPEEFAKYAELMKSLGFGKSKDEGEPENESVGSIIENLADVVAGAPKALEAFQALTKNGQPQIPVPEGEALPGSAASVLRR